MHNDVNNFINSDLISATLRHYGSHFNCSWQFLDANGRLETKGLHLMGFNAMMWGSMCIAVTLLIRI